MNQFDFRELKIPFRVSFKHASAERSVTQSILVIAKSEDDIMGMGEGCPREYVTGENPESGIQFLKSIEKPISEIGSPDELAEWVDRNQLLLDENPAAWCAMELALLDLFGRKQGKGTEELIGCKRLGEAFRYTAVLGDSSMETFTSQIGRYVSLGFHDFKIKISGKSKMDSKKLTLLRETAGKAARIRLDANNFWVDSADAMEYIRSLPDGVFALEEPLKAFDFPGMLKLHEGTGVRIILDESVLTLKHLEKFNQHPDVFIINARVSKMGGLYRTMGICRRAREAGIPIVVGAQLGESSILTRAALTVANDCGSALLAQEGAFGTLLLEEDLVEHPLMFGKRGVLHPSAFLKPDLGGSQLVFTRLRLCL